MRQASKKTTKIRLNWFGHVNRRDKERTLRKVLRTDIAGKGREDDGKQIEKTRQETYWTESGRGDGQGEMELFIPASLNGHPWKRRKNMPILQLKAVVGILFLTVERHHYKCTGLDVNSNRL